MKKRILSKLNCCNSNRQRNFFVETVLINSTVFCSDFDANFLLLDSRKGINQKLPDEIVSKRIFKYGGELRNVKNFTPFRLHNSGMSGMSHLFGELRNVRNFTLFRSCQSWRHSVNVIPVKFSDWLNPSIIKVRYYSFVWDRKSFSLHTAHLKTTLNWRRLCLPTFVKKIECIISDRFWLCGIFKFLLKFCPFACLTEKICAAILKKTLHTFCIAAFPKK